MRDEFGRANDRAEAILGVVSLAAQSSSSGSSWQGMAAELVAGLGHAVEASRAYVFENSSLKDGKLGMKERLHWTGTGATSTVLEADGKPVPYGRRQQNHLRLLSAGELLIGSAAGLPHGATAASGNGGGSAICVPVFVGDEWWGFLRFDFQESDLNRPTFEIEALRVAAAVLGGATYRELADRELRRAEAWLKSHIENIPAVTYIEYTDPDHPLGYAEAYVSPQITTMFGYTQEEWLHDEDLALWARVIHPDDRKRVDEEAARTAETGEPYEAEYRMLRKDGTWVRVRDEAHLVKDNPDLPPYWHGVIVDITARKEAEEKVAFLAFLAYHDYLTGLANRALFEEMLDPALARARRNDLSVAVLFLDLDDFKNVNDRFGHDIGDLLLKQAAERLAGVIRETDLIARQGGDEFLIMLPDLLRREEGAELIDGRDRAVRVVEMTAERIHQCLRTPFDLGEEEVTVSASIGISIFPLDAVDARDLIKNADAAMYESKQARPGSHIIPAAARGDALTRLSMAKRLREAAKKQRWALHYQPIVDLASGAIFGAEALLRWRRPKGDLIPPGEFIPLAEEMGLLELIGDWVLDEICRQAAAWDAQGLRLQLSFNLSPRQLWQRDLAAHIGSTLGQAGIDSSRVILEIAESTAVTDPARTKRILRELHDSGLKLAIDDFGSGYSSPRRLENLPVDILKIDQPLIRDLPQDQEVGDFVKAVIAFAQRLGITTSAEGIETPEQRDYLVQSGCALGQGYFFSRPVPGAELAKAFGSTGEAGSL